MREYYEGNKKTFVNPAKAIAQHSIIPTKDQDENSYSDEKVEEQRKLAFKVRDLIKAGRDFEALRQQYSVNYFANTASKSSGMHCNFGFTVLQTFQSTILRA
ncbi:MAG: hypothetical protein GXY86_01035 [Firmicutes bacterium]|nr:hypothetical protein [Bacillota bacterium]